MQGPNLKHWHKLWEANYMMNWKCLHPGSKVIFSPVFFVIAFFLLTGYSFSWLLDKTCAFWKAAEVDEDGIVEGREFDE